MLKAGSLPKIIENLKFIDLTREISLTYFKIKEIVEAIRHQVNAISARAAAAIADKPGRPRIAARTISHLAGFAYATAWIDEAPQRNGIALLHVRLKNLSTIPGSFTVSVRSLTPGVRLGAANELSDSIHLHHTHVKAAGDATVTTRLASDRVGVAELEISVESIDTVGRTALGSFPMRTHFR